MGKKNVGSNDPTKTSKLQNFGKATMMDSSFASTGASSDPIETSAPGLESGSQPSGRVKDAGFGKIKKITVSDPQRHGSGVNSYVVSFHPH